MSRRSKKRLLPSADGKSREILAELVRQGWLVEPTNGDHLRCIPPHRDAPIVFASLTPSDRRATASWLADLRRSGFSYPGE